MATFIILSPGFPKDEEDTSCLPAPQQFVLALQKNYPQHSFIVLTFQYPFERRSYVWHRVQVIALGGANRPGAGRFITWLKAYRQLQTLHKKNEISGMISLWLTECALIGSFFSGSKGIPHYTWMQGQDAKKSNQYVRRIRPNANNVIAISHFNSEEFRKNHGKTPFLIAENGVTPSLFPALNTDSRDIDILGVGSLIALKNYPLFIDIVAELKKTKPDLNVVIAGTGVQEEEIKSYAGKLNLTDTIRFTGGISHPEVLHLMSNTKIFLHTSDYEGNSTVLIEALYSGCYTFSTCPLSDTETERLTILKTKEDFVSVIKKQLDAATFLPKRIVFNTMEHTAKKIMNLFLSKG